MNRLHCMRLMRQCLLAVLLACASAWALAETRIADDEPVSSGQLRSFGAYLTPLSGATVTVLSNGAVLVYGHGPNTISDNSPEAQAMFMRTRRERAIPSGPSPQPKAWDPARRGWRRLPDAPACERGAHYMHTATALPAGKVLIAGGLCDHQMAGDDPAPHPAFAALSLWDSASRQWLAAPSLQQPRIYHSANLMPDGSVLIVGGESDPGLSDAVQEPVLASVEQFAAGRVTPMPPLATPRAKHTTTTLADGNALVVGGFDAEGHALASAELWNASTRAWQALPPLRHARHSHTATRLEDGRVMVAGGLDLNEQLLASVEIWDPRDQTWSEGADLPLPLYGHAATLLTNGKMLIAGGAWLTHWGPLPWAWTWSPIKDAWQVAGHITQNLPSGRAALSSEVTLVAQPEGRALVFTGQGIMRYEPGVKDPLSVPPVWAEKPAMTLLTDGRVMLVGKPESDMGTQKKIAVLWHPVERTWTPAGSVNQSHWGKASLLQLPSGRVIHVDIDGSRNTLICDLWDAASNVWHGCGSMQLRFNSPWQVRLGLLADGRVFAIANSSEVMVLNEAQGAWTPWRTEWKTEGLAYGAPIRSEKPLLRIHDEANAQWHEINDAAARFWQDSSENQGFRMLWDSKAGLWAYLLQDATIGSDARWLPDGCAISAKALAVFNPMTAKFAPLIDPGLGVSAGRFDSLVLPDGTVVVAGASDDAKDPGTGFFARKASCAGFVPDAADEGYIAGGLVDDSAPVSVATAPAPSPQMPASPWRERAMRFMQGLHEHRWLLLACFGPVLAYLVARRLGIQRIQIGPSWTLRLLIYGFCLIYLVPALWGYFGFVMATKAQACADDPKACLNQSTGLLKNGVIPCRMVGVWSSRQGAEMFRIELKDDGTYFMDPGQQRMRNPSGYTGHWAVLGTNLVWRHDQGVSNELDINPIQPESDTRFKLVEGNGSQTQYELIRAVPSKRCQP